MNGENVSCLVGTTSLGEQAIWCELGVPGKHEGDVDVTDMALANHFHCPSKQEAVLIRAGGVVKENG